jgi:hypothetical protein
VGSWGGTGQGGGGGIAPERWIGDDATTALHLGEGERMVRGS